MNPEWRARQKARLEAELDLLRRDIESETDQLQKMGTSNPSEPGDIAEEDREDVEVARTLEVSQTNFQDVKEALTRLQKGNYGRCLRCRGWLTKERLRAMPWAVRCVPCQEEHEKQDS